MRWCFRRFGPFYSRLVNGGSCNRELKGHILTLCGKPHRVIARSNLRSRL